MFKGEKGNSYLKNCYRCTAIIIIILFVLISCKGESSEPTGPPDLPCTLIVTSPTSASIWTIGQPRPITWSTSGTCGGNVMIELYKGTLRSCIIVSSTENDGDFGWTVTNCGNGGTDYRVKVTDLETSEFDFSSYFQYNM